MKKTIIALLIMLTLTVSLFKQLAQQSTPNHFSNTSANVAEAQNLYKLYLPYVQYTDPITTVEIIILNKRYIINRDMNYHDAFYNTNNYFSPDSYGIGAYVAPWLNDMGDPNYWEYQIGRSFFELTVPNNLPKGKITSIVLFIPLCQGHTYMNWLGNPPIEYIPYPYTYTIDLIDVPGSVIDLQDLYNIPVTDTGVGNIEIKPTTLISRTMDQTFGHCVAWDSSKNVFNGEDYKINYYYYYWNTQIAMDLNRLAPKIQPGATLQFMLHDPNDTRDMRPIIAKPQMFPDHPGATYSAETTLMTRGSTFLADDIYDAPMVTSQPVTLYTKLLITIDTSQEP